MSSEDGKTIWQLQEELRRWHESEYKQAYPNSKFTTGRDLHESRPKERTYDELTDEEKEHKEQVAYRLNCALFSMGTNLDGRFSDKPEGQNQ